MILILKGVRALSESPWKWALRSPLAPYAAHTRPSTKHLRHKYHRMSAFRYRSWPPWLARLALLAVVLMIGYG